MLRQRPWLVLGALVLLSSAGIAWGEESMDEKDVMVLDDASFDSELAKHKYLLVEFYAVRGALLKIMERARSSECEARHAVELLPRAHAIGRGGACFARRVLCGSRGTQDFSKQTKD